MGGGETLSSGPGKRAARPIFEVSGAAGGFFRLGPAGNSATGGAFAIGRPPAGTRLDPEYHSQSEAASRLDLRNPRKLATLWELVDSGRPIRPRAAEDGIVAYEVSHIAEGALLDSSVRVDPKSDRLLSRGDILTGRVGSLGVFACFEGEAPASYSDNTLRIRLNRKNQRRIGFVCEFLNSGPGRAQVLRGSRGSLQKVVTQASLAEVMIPSLGALEDRLVAELDSARSRKDEALATADALLADIDSVILDALGLALPPPHDPARPFAVRFAQLASGGKLVPGYYHPDRLHATDSIRSTGAFATIGGLADLERGQRLIRPDDFYVGLARVASHTGELAEVTESVDGVVVTFERGDVLFARLRPYLNKVWVADREGVASPEFYVIRPRAGVSPDYLAAVLRSSLTRAQTRHLMTGNTHPRIGPDDFKAILVPLGSERTRAVIASEVDRRRAEARRLRDDARKTWEAARARFEQAVSGPAA
jgi:hypothetical protein